MTDPSKKEITTIVKQVLKETGRVSKSSDNPSPTQSKPSGNGPAVLNIFHAGVRKLEEALQQVQQIEETARRSSVYTVESARSWVCGADVKEGAAFGLEPKLPVWPATTRRPIWCSQRYCKAKRCWRPMMDSCSATFSSMNSCAVKSAEF
jgi:hypothetical protein